MNCGSSFSPARSCKGNSLVVFFSFADHGEFWVERLVLVRIDEEHEG